MDRAPVYFVAKRSQSSSSSYQRRDDNENNDGHDDAIDQKLITVILRLSPLSCGQIITGSQIVLITTIMMSMVIVIKP